jgi:hypothetical protein
MMKSLAANSDKTELLKLFDGRLHELSQPLTVLLCTLEHGRDLDTVTEMRPVVTGALRECERLRKTIAKMREDVLEAME